MSFVLNPPKWQFIEDKQTPEYSWRLLKVHLRSYVLFSFGTDIFTHALTHTHETQSVVWRGQSTMSHCETLRLIKISHSLLKTKYIQLYLKIIAMIKKKKIIIILIYSPPNPGLSLLS